LRTARPTSVRSATNSGSPRVAIWSRRPGSRTGRSRTRPAAAACERHPGGLELRGVPAGADSEREPAAGEPVERGGLVGDDDRVVRGQDQDAGHQPDPSRRPGHGGQQDQRVRGHAHRPRQQMAARDEMVEAQLLGGSGDFEDAVELVLVSGPQTVRCDSQTHAGATPAAHPLPCLLLHGSAGPRMVEIDGIKSPRVRVT
jgi:hypothetical protein